VAHGRKAPVAEAAYRRAGRAARSELVRARDRMRA
jgi:hypothetical protein